MGHGGLFFSFFGGGFSFGFFFPLSCFWRLQGASAKTICRFGERSGGKPTVLARDEQGWSGILEESKKKGGGEEKEESCKAPACI